MHRSNQRFSGLTTSNTGKEYPNGCGGSRCFVNAGMLLSRSWAAKLKGTLQIDMSYATIPIFVEQRRLYRENRLAYMISSPKCPQNHPIYSIDTDLGSVIFCNELAK